MPESKTYNGWANYETWNVALWLDNDQGSYSHWNAVAQECWDDACDKDTGILTREERAVYALSAMLKSDFEENAPDLGASCWSDLLSAALSEVDWDEIAQHYMDEVEKEEEADEDEIDAADPSEEEREAAGDDE